MTHIFTPERDPELLARARDLGTAMQLTNILRDVGEDLRLDRIYLPATELTQYGVAEADLRAGQVTEEFRALMRFQFARARDYYRSAEPGIVRLPADGTRRTAWTMANIYGAILGEIEKADYRVFDRRAKTSLAQKCVLAFGAWRKS
jgi:phytoene synthase